MKIVQFMASEGWGGAESVFVELTNELAETHHVTALLLRETQYQAKFSSNVDCVVLRSNPTRYNPFLIYEIFCRLREIQPDVVHTHAVKGTELVFSANRFGQFPHVATKHNVRKGKIFNKLKWVTVVSEASRQTVLATNRKRPKVIYNGIRPMPLEVAEKYDVFTILAIGRLDKVKGFDILIKQVKALDFDFRLLIVGEGPERENLENTLRDAGMEGKAQLIGFRDDIPHMMKKSHVVVVSSYTEGFSKVLVEGIFYADVVISTPVGIAMEIFPSKFLTEQDHLGEKISDAHRNFLCFKNEFQKVKELRGEEFLFPAIVEKYTDLYQQILREGRSG